MSLSRISSDEVYVALLGKAIYDFAALEWSMKYLGWALDREFITDVEKVPTNWIVGKLRHLSLAAVVVHERRKEYMGLVDEFDELVTSRDQLVHGNPYTDEQEGQRLNYRGRHAPKRWLKNDLEFFITQVSDLFVRTNEFVRSDWISHPYSKPESST